MNRPWDSIEKVEQAFSAYNRGQKRLGGQLTARAFHDRCVTGLTGITPTEKAAIARWVASKMRG